MVKSTEGTARCGCSAHPRSRNTVALPEASTIREGEHAGEPQGHGFDTVHGFPDFLDPTVAFPDDLHRRGHVVPDLFRRLKQPEYRRDRRDVEREVGVNATRLHELLLRELHQQAQGMSDPFHDGSIGP
ncbi:hypothetical protein [Methanopyrus sp.]